MYVKDIKNYLGFTPYYGSSYMIIQGYSECSRIIAMVKLVLTSAPILAYPRNILPVILDGNTCNSGVGGVLSQVQTENERVIAFTSRAMRNNERHCCVNLKNY